MAYSGTPDSTLPKCYRTMCRVTAVSSKLTVDSVKWVTLHVRALQMRVISCEANNGATHSSLHKTHLQVCTLPHIKLEQLVSPLIMGKWVNRRDGYCFFKAAYQEFFLPKILKRTPSHSDFKLNVTANKFCPMSSKLRIDS